MDNKTVSTASKYPEKPITLIVPFGAGSGMDLVARLLEKSISTQLGQPLMIVNKPGGGGTIGLNELINTPSDGYTLGMTGVEVIMQPMYGTTKYHYPTALEPLVQLSTFPIVMAVKANQPWQSVEDVIRYARQHPGEIKFSHSGLGSISHLAGETFGKSSGITLDQVPFQSAPEALASLLGEHVQILFANPASVKEHVKNGTVRALAIAGDQRVSDPLFANIPTFKESGIQVVGSSWYGVAAPKELPVEVKNKLAAAFKKTAEDPEFQKNIANLGLQFSYLGPKECTDKWIEESQKLSAAVQETGILEKIQAQKK